MNTGEQSLKYSAEREAELRSIVTSRVTLPLDSAITGAWSQYDETFMEAAYYNEASRRLGTSAPAADAKNQEFDEARVNYMIQACELERRRDVVAGIVGRCPMRMLIHPDIVHDVYAAEHLAYAIKPDMHKAITAWTGIGRWGHMWKADKAAAIAARDYAENPWVSLGSYYWAG